MPENSMKLESQLVKGPLSYLIENVKADYAL